MSEMVERVARAICKANGEDPDVGRNPRWTAFEAEARAAIEAMREPTDAMKTCSEEVHWGYSCAVCGGLEEGWRAMIDAALKP